MIFLIYYIMKHRLLNLFRSACLIYVLLTVAWIYLPAQTVEKIVLYENFGGPDAGSSVSGIIPEKWPAVHSDSGYHSGWYTTSQNIDGKTGAIIPVPQFYGNGFFHIDSVKKYRTNGLAGLNILVDDVTKTWSKSVSLRNGYKIFDPLKMQYKDNVDIKVFGGACLPEFYSWISYAPYTPDFLKNQVDEKGYLYLGKNVTPMSNARPIIKIPGSDFEMLENISKIEMLISGSRLANNNTVSVKIEELDYEGMTLGSKTLTFSVSVEPRLITIPILFQYCRIYIQSWGAANNANVTDFALLNNNTEIDTRATFNYNAIECTKPDGTASSGQTGNPGVQIHMIKLYSKLPGSYTITTDPSLVTGKTTGISHGEIVQLTAASTKNGKKFMGWKISGKPDLSEVVNPLSITVNGDMTILPVYAGDEVELPVVDENFSNWQQHGNVDPTKNNMLIYANTPTASQDTISKNVKVPLRWGFTYQGKDSIDIFISKCNVIPQYGPRIVNIPDYDKYRGYIAFMGPNASKGFIRVDTLLGITKVEADVSVYDLPHPNRACAFKINDTIVRNKMLQKIYPEKVVINVSKNKKFSLKVGPGNQAQCEYLVPASANANIDGSNISAAAIALHNLKMYAKVTVPDKNYYKLTLQTSVGGKIAGVYPSAGNSTNHYIEGTNVTITAVADIGYGFDGWYDNNNQLISIDNPVTITMNSDKNIKAVFAQNPSFIKLIKNADGTVTTNPRPLSVKDDTLTFLAGIPVTLTADPRYGYKFVKWTKNGGDVTSNPMTLSASEMIKYATNIIAVVYDSITERQQITVITDTTKGYVAFSNEPENIIWNNDTLKGLFPQGEVIEFTAKPAYGYAFDRWSGGFSVPNADTLKNPVSLTINADKIIKANWKPLSRKYLKIINISQNGTIVVSDIHKNGELEQQNLWPIDYYVQLTARPKSGYILSSLGSDVTARYINDSIVEVLMDKDTVTIIPEFVVRVEGVFFVVNENFQDPTRWPENPGTISNVPGAIEFLGLDPSWDPRVYNYKLEELLKILAPYREWGSQSNDNSDGPSGTKNPPTTLNLVYNKNVYSVKLKTQTGYDSVKISVVNYAPCNNCLIAKAVKLQNISNRYLGHVTPGMVALKKPPVTGRSANDYPPIVRGDSLGMMLIEGLVYVEKLEIGYVSGTSQFCPGVLYTIDPSVKPIGDNGLFNAYYSDFISIGQVARPDYRPDQGKYGWGCSQEGMIMDQNMYIAEEGVPETKILITAGFRNVSGTYYYSDIFIHDLKIWGSPKKLSAISVRKLFGNDNNDGNARFYILGNTNNLKMEVNEPVKTLVIYNLNGVAIKVIKDINDNIVDVGNLLPGVYGVHAYGISGKLYMGKFGKL